MKDRVDDQNNLKSIDSGMANSPSETVPTHESIPTKCEDHISQTLISESLNNGAEDSVVINDNILKKLPFLKSIKKKKISSANNFTDQDALYNFFGIVPQDIPPYICQEEAEYVYNKLYLRYQQEWEGYQYLRSEIGRKINMFVMIIALIVTISFSIFTIWNLEIIDYFNEFISRLHEDLDGYWLSSHYVDYPLMVKIFSGIIPLLAMYLYLLVTFMYYHSKYNNTNYILMYPSNVGVLESMITQPSENYSFEYMDYLNSDINELRNINEIIFKINNKIRHYLYGVDIMSIALLSYEFVLFIIIIAQYI
ncbi:hypothetical protein McpSp1_09220 [Methanocorpusculaceae archaeon Sp1]|nr:hypothetical protein [Methanocorpusculaceae archaeon Sp1]